MGLLYAINKNTHADQRPLPGAEKRNLLRAALSCFAIHGFAKASLKKIADEANMTAAMVNYYFGSKKSLYSEVLHMCYEQLLELVNERNKLTDNFEAFLSHFLYAHLEFARTYPHAAALIVQTSYSTNELPVSEHMTTFAPFRELLETKFNESISSGEYKPDQRLSMKELTEYFLGQAEYVLIRHVQSQNIQHTKVRPIPKTEDILRIFLQGTTSTSDL